MLRVSKYYKRQADKAVNWQDSRFSSFWSQFPYGLDNRVAASIIILRYEE